MSFRTVAPDRTADVVAGAPRALWSRTGGAALRAGRTAAALLALMLAVVLALAMPAAAFADDGGSSTVDGVTVTDSITDTENLLGDNLGKVTDAINSTKSETGVTLRLLFLPNFAESTDPDQWTSDVLESTDPVANTVMLAVASEDGNLVVAVSSNSDSWLKDQQTVDSLSEAALAPLTEGDTPDWSGSAIALADRIKEIRHPSPGEWASRHRVVLIAVAVVVVVAVAAVAVAVVVRRRATRARRQIERRRRRRHAGGRGRPAPSGSDGADASGDAGDGDASGSDGEGDGTEEAGDPAADGSDGDDGSDAGTATATGVHGPDALERIADGVSADISTVGDGSGAATIVIRGVADIDVDLDAPSGASSAAAADTASGDDGGDPPDDGADDDADHAKYRPPRQ